MVQLHDINEKRETQPTTTVEIGIRFSGVSNDWNGDRIWQ